MPESINSKIKEQYDHDDSGGSLDTNLGDFLDSEGASGTSNNSKWRDWAEGTGTSLNTRLFHKHGGSGSFNTRWKNWVAFSSTHSFNFDGSNDYLDAGTSLGNTLGDNYSGDLSVSMWFKASATNVEEGLFTIGNFNGAYGEIDIAYSINKIYLSLNANAWNGYINNTSTDWQHIAVVYKAGSESDTKVYINGSHVSFVATSGTFPSSANMDFNGLKNIIGAYYNTSYTFTGLIDEVAVWDTALSASDVTSIYNNGKVIDLSKSTAYGVDRTGNLKLWLRCGDKAEPESNTAIARQDFYTDFDGTDDVVSISNTVAPTEAVSVSAWVRFDALQDYDLVVGNTDTGTNGWRLAMDNANNIIFAINAWGSNHAETPMSATGVWHHLVGTYDKNNIKIYLNGELKGTDAYTDSITYSSNVFQIGGASGWSNLDGSISNVSVYQTALDAQTISQMAKSRFTPMRDNRFSVVDFDGTNDFIDTGTGLPDVTSGAFTISGWFNFDSVSATHWLWGRGTGSGSGYAIKFDTTPRLIAQSKTASSYQYYASNYTFSVGEWYHIVFVHSGTGTTPKIYINGVENAGSGAWNSDIVSQSSLSFKIGSNEGTSNEFDGQIASVAWYSEAKDAEFVYAQYQKGITHNPSADTALEGLWLMGDDTSKAYPTIADSSSNSNDGTITNGASDDIVQQMVAGYDLGAFESSSEELGANLIEDSGFDDASYWNAAGNWSVSGSKATSGTGTYDILQPSSDYSLVSGKLYKFTASITLVSGSGNFAFFANDTNIALTLTSGTNTYTTYLISDGAVPRIRMQGGSAIIEVDDFSVKEVLQSEVSDTYPAIIDVNEPVLGAELITNGDFELDSNWANYNTPTVNERSTEQANGGTYSRKFTADAISDGIQGDTFSVTAGKTYKVSLDVYPDDNTQIRWLIREGDDSAWDTDNNYTSLTQDAWNTLEKTYVATSSGSGAYIAILSKLTSGTYYIDNVTVKEIQGNVGTMTNQDSADLVYSSVLPDQSFLTGVNSAYNFVSLDGTNDYIKNESYTAHQQDTGTISVWVKFGDISGYQYVVGVGGNTSTGTNRVITLLNENLRFSGYSADFDTGADVSADTWYHIVLIWNGTSVTFYLDGTAYTNTQSNLVTPTGTNFVVGAYPAGFSTPTNGDFGTVAHWNKVLTSTEVNAIKDLGRHGNLLDSYSDNLKLCYSMSGLDAKTGFSDTATTIYDRSGNSNHGTTVSIASADLKSSPNAEPNGYAKGDTNRSTTTP